MALFPKFDEFDPISGIVPSYPFSCLPAIAARARKLLLSRTVEEIISIDGSMSCLLDEYFDRVKEDEIRYLEETGDDYFCLLENDDSGGCRFRFNHELEGELDIPRPERTSEVDALKQCTESLTKLGEKYDPEAEPCEFFAVLSLGLIGHTLWWLHHTRSDILNELPIKLAETIRKDKPLFDAVLGTDEQRQASETAADSAINAMDAVCYAEHLHEEDRWISMLGDAFRQAHERQKTELEAAAREDVKEACASSAAYAIELIMKERAEKNASIARQLNEKRHAKRNEARALVCNEWDKNRSPFLSAEKAGGHFADWLEKKGYHFEPRTVTGWIRAHAKKIGKRLR